MSYGNPLVVQKFRVSKNFMLQRIMSHFSVELFCFTLSKKFVGEAYSAVFQKKSGSEKVYGKEGLGEYQDFPSKIFRLIVPKVFVGKLFCTVFQ